MKTEKNFLDFVQWTNEIHSPDGPQTLGGAHAQPYSKCVRLSEENERPNLDGQPDVHHLGCNVAEGQVADYRLLLP